MSYVKVGQKYGVSDNCIRKWLRKYDMFSNKLNKIENKYNNELT